MIKLKDLFFILIIITFFIYTSSSSAEYDIGQVETLKKLDPSLQDTDFKDMENKKIDIDKVIRLKKIFKKEKIRTLVALSKKELNIDSIEKISRDERFQNLKPIDYVKMNEGNLNLDLISEYIQFDKNVSKEDFFDSKEKKINFKNAIEILKINPNSEFDYNYFFKEQKEDPDFTLLLDIMKTFPATDIYSINYIKNEYLTFKENFPDLSLNEYKIVKSKEVSLQSLIEFKKNKPDLSFEMILKEIDNPTNTPDAIKYKQYDPHISDNDIQKMKDANVNLYIAGQFKGIDPNINTSDFINMANSGIDFFSAYKYKYLFPKSHPSDFIKLGNKKIDLSLEKYKDLFGNEIAEKYRDEASKFKEIFPDSDLADYVLFKKHNRYIQLDDLEKYKNSEASFSLEKMKDNLDINLYYVMKYKELIPEISFDDQVKMKKNSVNIHEVFIFNKEIKDKLGADIVLTPNELIELQKKNISLEKSKSLIDNYGKISKEELIKLAEIKSNFLKQHIENDDMLELFEKTQSDYLLADLFLKQFKNMSLHHLWLQIIKQSDTKELDELIYYIKLTIDPNFDNKFSKDGLKKLSSMEKEKINFTDLISLKKNFYEEELDKIIESLIKIRDKGLNIKHIVKTKKHFPSLTLSNVLEALIQAKEDQVPSKDIEELRGKYRITLKKYIMDPNGLILGSANTKNFNYQNENCFKEIKYKIVKLLDSLWPSIGLGGKKTILKNSSCNDAIRNDYLNLDNNGGKNSNLNNFSFIEKTFVPLEFEGYFSSLSKDFISICKERIEEKNYIEIFNRVLNNPMLGGLLIQLLKEEPLSSSCQGLEIETRNEDSQIMHKIPTWNNLPKGFSEAENQNIHQYKMIKVVTSNEYVKAFQRYREIESDEVFKEKDSLNKELASLPPLKKELLLKQNGMHEITPSKQSVVVWRNANTAFNDTPFSALKKDKVYCEKAPTCSSQIELFDSFNKNYHMKIFLPFEHNIARIVESISSYGNKEREILIPSDNCFKYLGVSKEKKDSNTIDVYNFELVPWTEHKKYGYFSRKNAIIEAYAPYSKSYKTPNTTSFGKYVVQRPNHGLTHGARQAYLTLDLLQHLSENPNYGKLHEWAKKIKSNFNQKDALFLMALHFRAARLDETENYFDEYVKHAKKVLTKNQRLDSKEDEKTFAKLCSEDPIGNPETCDPRMKYAMMVLDVTHRTDHMRQPFWDMEESVKDQKYSLGALGGQSTENQESIIKFLQERESIYLEKTGAYNRLNDPNKDFKNRVYEYKNPELFGELENNPSKLYKIMESITLDKA